MAHAKARESTRSLASLNRAIELTLRLVERSGSIPGQVSVLFGRVRRAQSRWDAHRKSQPLEKRKARQLGDEVLENLVELLTVVVATENKR
jgi:hypothetical protein